MSLGTPGTPGTPSTPSTPAPTGLSNSTKGIAGAVAVAAIAALAFLGGKDCANNGTDVSTSTVTSNTNTVSDGAQAVISNSDYADLATTNGNGSVTIAGNQEETTPTTSPQTINTVYTNSTGIGSVNQVVTINGTEGSGQ